MKKRLTALFTLVFLLHHTLCYGLAPRSNLHETLFKRKIFAAFYKNRVQYSPSASQVLENNDLSCALLSSGKYLVSKELAEPQDQDYLPLIGTVIERDIQVLLQNMAKTGKYRRIRAMVLEFLSPTGNVNINLDLYVNYSVARAFKWLTLLEYGLVNREDIPQEEQKFLSIIEPVIRENKHNLFTSEFFSPQDRRNIIQKAVRKGKNFYFLGDIASNIVALGENVSTKKIGHKAKSFITFKKQGLPYPQGLVINTDLVNIIRYNPVIAGDVADKLLDSLKKQGIVLSKENPLIVRSSPVESNPGIYSTIPKVTTREELIQAIKAVADSWDTEQAKAMREKLGISEESGMAIIVQEEIETDTNQVSGSGVVFSRNPNDGEKGLFGNYQKQAKGAEIVTNEGERTIKALNESGLDDVLYKQVEAAVLNIEQDDRYAQEIEFCVKNRKLYFLQHRKILFSPAAHVRYIQDAVSEGLLRDVDVILEMKKLQQRVGKRILYKIKQDITKKEVIKGRTATPGAMAGSLVFTIEEAEKLAQRGEKVILAIGKDKKALDFIERIWEIPEIGVVTAYGNASSHEVVLLRNAGVPVIVNADISAFQVAAGEVVVIDGNNNEIWKTGNKDILEEDRVVIDASFGIDIAQYREDFCKSYLNISGKVRSRISYDQLMKENLAAWRAYEEAEAAGAPQKVFETNLRKNILHDLFRQKAYESQGQTETRADAALHQYFVAEWNKTLNFEIADLVDRILCNLYYGDAGGNYNLDRLLEHCSEYGKAGGLGGQNDPNFSSYYQYKYEYDTAKSAYRKKFHDFLDKEFKEEMLSAIKNSGFFELLDNGRFKMTAKGNRRAEALARPLGILHGLWGALIKSAEYKEREGQGDALPLAFFSAVVPVRYPKETSKKIDTSQVVADTMVEEKFKLINLEAIPEWMTSKDLYLDPAISLLGNRAHGHVIPLRKEKTGEEIKEGILDETTQGSRITGEAVGIPSDILGYISLNPPKDKIVFLKNILGLEAISEAILGQYDDILLSQYIRLVEVLSMDFNHRKPLVIPTEIRDLFLKRGVVLPDDRLSIKDFLIFTRPLREPPAIVKAREDLKRYVEENIFKLGDDNDLSKIGVKAKAFVGRPLYQGTVNERRGLVISSDLVSNMAGNQEVILAVVDRLIDYFAIKEEGGIFVSESSQGLRFPKNGFIIYMSPIKETAIPFIINDSLNNRERLTAALKIMSASSEVSFFAVVVEQDTSEGLSIDLMDDRDLKNSESETGVPLYRVHPNYILSHA